MEITREEAKKYLIRPVATSTEPSKEYLKQKAAYDMAMLLLNGDNITECPWCGTVINHTETNNDKVEYINYPIITDQPSRKGYWKRFEDDKCYWYGCSECKHEISKDKWGHDNFSSFCPDCGAEMRGVECPK